MIERVRGSTHYVLQSGLKVHWRAALLAAAAALIPATASAQAISAPPALAAPPPRQPISNSPVLNQPASNPICVRLEGQLAGLNQGAGDPARADQIRRAEDAIAKQQADLDRTVGQAHKAGCAGQGFFALFSALSPQCGPITSQIQQMRGNLDRMISDLEQLKNGNTGQEGQRRALIGQLAQNNCGAQYTAAANSWGGPQGFFDALFGGGTIVNPSNVQRPKRNCTPSAIPARTWNRQSRSAGSPIQRCRTPSVTARRSPPLAHAEDPARAGPRRSRMPTIQAP